MATTELDILMQQKIGNDTKIMYPVTKIRNVIDENNNSLADFLLGFVSAIITENGSYLMTEDGSYIIAGS